MKPLSEQLANLSVRAKNTEDAAAAAQKEAHDKVVARVAQAQANAEQAESREGEIRSTFNGQIVLPLG